MNFTLLFFAVYFEVPHSSGHFCATPAPTLALVKHEDKIDDAIIFFASLEKTHSASAFDY